MSESTEALLIDLLDWIGPARRSYTEVMTAWRTSCPHLPIWEEANDRGFVERHHIAGEGSFISVSAAGRAFLDAARLTPRSRIP